MSQNHITSDGIPGRGHLDESLPNTMGQYHGGYPWFCTLWALLPIRDLERSFPRAYTTSPRQIRVCLETYSLHHRSSTCWIPFFITFCTHCRYIRFTSFNKFIMTYSIKHNFIKWVSIQGQHSIKWIVIKDNTQHHIVNKHHITTDLHHLPSPSSHK